MNVPMKDVLEQFDAYLFEKGLRYESTVVGGAALLMLGVITRATQDVDCLTPMMPPTIAKAASDFAKTRSALKLDKDWFNNGPASLANELPPGWVTRCIPLFRGRALVLNTLGRLDLLRAKIYALLDRQKDLDDCLALKPTADELRECHPWLEYRDANPLWPDHVRKTLVMLGRRMGYELKL